VFHECFISKGGMMKKVFLILVVLSLMIECGPKVISNQDPDSLAKTAFLALKTGKVEYLLHCIPKASDFKMLASRAEKKIIHEGTLEEAKKSIQEEMNEMDKKVDELKKELYEIRKEGISSGINWDETEFVRAEYEIDKEERFEIIVTETDIEIIFSYKDSLFKFDLDECQEFPRGWTCTSDSTLGYFRFGGWLDPLRDKYYRTYRNLKNIGTAIEDYIIDYGKAPEGKTFVYELQKDLAPFYIKILPIKDAWGNNFYYKKEAPDTYWIASAGSDGKFDGFTQKGIYTELEGKDIIFSKGVFGFASERKIIYPIK
jgi:hypothetical protein